MKKLSILILLFVSIISCKSSESKQVEPPKNHYGRYYLDWYLVTDLRDNTLIKPVTGYTDIIEGKGIDIFIVSGSKVLLNQHLTFKEVVNSQNPDSIEFYNANEYRGYVNKSTGTLLFDFKRATIEQGYDCKFGLSFKKQ